ncbi:MULTISPECIES: MFS transporter [Pandoraea]|uniref:MFS transporter n=1 Tax=Pandoraea TaxID=93217 RepID=UPI001F5C5DEA|nr:MULTISPECIES: MFS transporter [Pandoraea]MCI3206399.1 MFS transporter [Pandoraea sp. LA3]MDN4584427.1 MFS transporter [Pandoraea capi]
MKPVSDKLENPIGVGLADIEAPSSVRWRIFLVVFAVVVVNFVDRTTLSVAMPTISAEFGLTPVMQGLILSAFFWSYMLLQLPGGWLLDRYGPRAVLTGATVGWGFFQTLAAFATGGMSLFFCRIGLGGLEAPLFPAGAKLSASWLPPRERGRGATLLDSGAPLGAAIGGAIIAWLISELNSWRAAFAVAGLATMVLGLVAWRYLRDKPSLHPGVNEQELSLIGSQAPSVMDSNASGFVLTRRSMGAILTGRAAWAMINFGLLTWGPSYLAQARHMNLKELGGVTFLMFAAGMLGSLCSGWLADTMHIRGMRRSVVYKSLLSISGVGTLCAFVVLPFLSNVVVAVAVLCTMLFLLYFGSLYWSLPALLAPPHRVGMVSGWMNFAGSASGIAIPIVAGFILQITGTYTAMFLYFAACAALYVLASVAITIHEPKAYGAAR